jgi:hypothetical protein
MGDTEEQGEEVVEGAARMTMDGAAALIAEYPNHIPANFLRMRNSAGVPRRDNGDEMLLDEYLDFVATFPQKWLTSLPPSWLSESALSQGKAVMGALEEACRRDDVCTDSWDDVTEALKTVTSKMLWEEECKRKTAKNLPLRPRSRTKTPSGVLPKREPRVQCDSEPLQPELADITQDDAAPIIDGNEDPSSYEDNEAPPSYKDTLKRFCIEYAAQTGQEGVHTLLSCLWNGRDDHSVDAIVEVLKSLAASDHKVLEVFRLLHGVIS